jgi:hypothetical protein
LPNRMRNRAFLPENAVTGERFGIRIILLPGLFH